MSTVTTHRRRPVLAAVALLTVALLATSGCSTETEADPPAMTMEQATSYYPGGCGVWDPRFVYVEATRAPDGTSNFFGPEGEAVADNVRAAAAAYAEASSRVTRILTDPPAPWPTEVAGDIDDLLVFQNALDPYLTAVAQPDSTWPAPLGAEVRANGRQAAEAVRAGLALPPFGEGCTGYTPADYVETISGAASSEAVELAVSYETVPDGNTTKSIEDGGTLQFGNIDFAGTGTLAGEPVEVGLQAHALFLDGTGPSGGFMDLTDDAGDVLVLELTSRATRVGEGAIVDGNLRVVGGTGRFAGVSGGGPGTGGRDAALGAAVRWTFQLQLEGL